MNSPVRLMEEAVTGALVVMAGILANPRPRTPEIIRMWALVLARAGMTPTDVKNTTEKVIVTVTFYPTPADFLGAWKPAVDTDLLAEAGWQRVRSCIRRYGYMASLCAGDLEGDRAALWSLSRIGWQRLCEELTVEEMVQTMFRKEFGRLYALAIRENNETVYLAGIAEARNLSMKRPWCGTEYGRPDWKLAPAERQAALDKGEIQVPLPADQLVKLEFPRFPEEGLE